MRTELIKAQSDPVWFIEDGFQCDLWEKQRLICQSVRDNRFTTVRSCHGTGKSFVSGRIALWFLYSHVDSVVITTAPTRRQVEEILWREIGSAYELSVIELGGNKLKTKIDVAEKWYALGLTAREPDKFQGFHAKDLLFIGEEAAGIEEGIYNAVDGCITSSNNKVLLIGNPTSLSGRFYNSHRQAKYNKIHISCFDTPNFVINNIKDIDDLKACNVDKVITIDENLITVQWAKEMLDDYGADNPIFESRVLGNFPSQGDNTLIPLVKLELAATDERRQEVAKGKLAFGVDVARYGTDKSVIIKRLGNNVRSITEMAKFDNMEVAGIVRKIARENRFVGDFFIDTIGLGSGVFDRLSEIEETKSIVYSVNVSQKSVNEGDKVSFFNLRSQLYWELRERFIRNEISIPNDPDLIAQLATMQYKIKGSSGKIYVEEKEEIKKRIGKSPDRADALMLSFAPKNRGSIEQVGIGKSYDEMYKE